jgi:Endosomal/lysosomal potassium channel TMEM175
MRHAVKKYRRLELVPYLYDENCYPSGFAGGHILVRVPEARSRYAGAIFGEGSDRILEDRLSVWSWDGGRLRRVVEEIEPGQGWVAFLMRSMQPLARHGDTVYPSLLASRRSEAFLETTCEAYRRELGELWEGIPAVFSDEPPDAERGGQTVVREGLARRQGGEEDFRWRGEDVSRIEAFTDAVFAFAVTLLVVSLEVPRTFEELLVAMRSFFAFAICFALVLLVWNERLTGILIGMTMLWGYGAVTTNQAQGPGGGPVTGDGDLWGAGAGRASSTRA